MEIIFLGTSCMVPTKDRNHVGVLLRYKNQGILFDCGEGIQRQIKTAGLKLTAVTKILISHWHGDHVLGLPGLISSLGASEYSGILEIYGPKGTKQRLNKLFDAFAFDKRVEMKIEEIKPGKFFENKEFELHAYKLDHKIETLGYSFVEKDSRKIIMSKAKKLGIKEGPLVGKLQRGETVMVNGKKIKPDDVSMIDEGKKITVISDTVLCKGCLDAAKDADLLVSEACYTSALQNKAEEYKHLTAKEAAQIASSSGVKKLILTHFSARYKDTHEIEEDAKDVFNDITCAKDFMKIKI